MTRSAGSGSLDPLLNKLQKYITLSREEVGPVSYTHLTLPTIYSV